jgi:ATP-binding cassette subfamily F protein 3
MGPAFIFQVSDLHKKFGQRELLKNVNLAFYPGAKIGLLGRNGAGKSTLMKIMAGIDKDFDGEARLAEGYTVGYLEQEPQLDLTKTVIDTLFEAVPDWTQTQVRSLLGSFCFSNDAVFKQVVQLSGGEKARLALALMLLTPCNLLILDEPTNHLDIPAKQMLEEALLAYGGSALIVSHDRYFIGRVANRIVELRNGELVLYRGDYAYYLERKREEADAERQAGEAKAAEAKQQANRLRQKQKQQQKQAARRNPAA